MKIIKPKTIKRSKEYFESGGDWPPCFNFFLFCVSFSCAFVRARVVWCVCESLAQQWSLTLSSFALSKKVWDCVVDKWTAVDSFLSCSG